jgi:hypothetical protein
MPDNTDETPGTLAPPNGGAVTNADLYRTLYELDRGLGERFTSLGNSINGVGERITQHIKEGHAEIEREISQKADKATVAELVDGWTFIRRLIQLSTSKPGLAIIAAILGAPLVAQWSQLGPEIIKLFPGT